MEIACLCHSYSFASHPRRSVSWFTLPMWCACKLVFSLTSTPSIFSSSLYHSRTESWSRNSTLLSRTPTDVRTLTTTVYKNEIFQSKASRYTGEDNNPRVNYSSSSPQSQDYFYSHSNYHGKTLEGLPTFNRLFLPKISWDFLYFASPWTPLTPFVSSTNQQHCIFSGH